MDINEALASLDPANDDQWTADGLPKVDVIRAATNDYALTRADITNAAPQFTRETAVDKDVPDEPNEDEDEGEEVDLPEPEPMPTTFESFNVKVSMYLVADPLKFYNSLPQITDQEEAAALVEELQPIVNDLVLARDHVQKALDAAQKNYQNARNRAASLEAPHQNQINIMKVIQSQQALRASKVNSIAAIKSALGVEGNVKLDARAPIDQAFDRKNQRGQKRPTR